MYQYLYIDNGNHNVVHTISVNGFLNGILFLALPVTYIGGGPTSCHAQTHVCNPLPPFSHLQLINPVIFSPYETQLATLPI